MTKPGYQLRLDPWAAEYEGSVQVLDGGEPAAVDTSVEQAAWAAIRPAPAPPPSRMAFVDGVRRIEHRLVVDAGERTAFGLLGSFGIGAVVVERQARVVGERIGRVAVAGGGLRLERLLVPIGRNEPLLFEPESEPENTPAAPVDGLQKAMRRERGGASPSACPPRSTSCSRTGRSPSSPRARPAVSSASSSACSATTSSPPQHALLPRLGVGERTPLFLIEGREPRYSWYQRIAFGRPIESALTGVVRLETAAGRGKDAARRLADLSAREIPRFASDATRDPRAPQNLLPIGGLEARLKHLLGDPAVVRRAVEAQHPQRGHRVSESVGRVLGTLDAMPLEFWVAVDEGQYLQLDDVVEVETPLPDGREVRLYGVVDLVRARHEGATASTPTSSSSRRASCRPRSPRPRTCASRASSPRCSCRRGRVSRCGAPVGLRRDEALFFDGDGARACRSACRATASPCTRTSTSSTARAAPTSTSRASRASPPRPPTRPSCCTACSPAARSAARPPTPRRSSST